MKKINCLLLGFTLCSIFSFSQPIKRLAAYDSKSSYTSGIFCISDNDIFRYSWYYQEWFPLSSDGLTSVNDSTRIAAIAVYNNKINNSSGIFVFSDTVVLNYNWFVQKWFDLKNTGLPLNSMNKPDVIDLAVYGDSGSSSNSQLFALTHSGIFRYNWYYQQWYPLSNAGLSLSQKSSQNDLFKIEVFPNPIETTSVIKILLPQVFSGNVEFSFFDMNGKHIFTDVVYFNTDDITYRINSVKFKQGVYYCEIKAANAYKSVRMLKL